MIVGVLSDTHGQVPEGLDEAFAGVERILHAGDVGGQRVLDVLEAIAPVVAVRGNMDTGDLEWRLPDTATVRLGDTKVLMLHSAERLPAHGLPEGVEVVVSGHTHRANVERSGGVLFVNPGSAGPGGRDGRGPTVAILEVGAVPTARIVEL